MPREANKCTDFLTKHGEDQDEPLVINYGGFTCRPRCLLNVDGTEVILILFNVFLFVNSGFIFDESIYMCVLYKHFICVLIELIGS